jgi:hypothetical protein
MNSLPLKSQELAMFLTYLDIKGYAPASIISYNSAIGYVHRLAGLPDPTSVNLIQKILSALVKISPSVDSRLPITEVLLFRMVESLKFVENSDYTKSLLHAMFVIAFFGLMRIGEVTSDNINQTAIMLNQIQLDKHKVTITISKFKHNIELQPFDIILYRQEQPQICPVRVLSHYLKLRGLQRGPHFVFANINPIPRYFFNRKLKECISFCGLDATCFKSHSMRIGGASYYANL